MKIFTSSVIKWVTGKPFPLPSTTDETLKDSHSKTNSCSDQIAIFVQVLPVKANICNVEIMLRYSQTKAKRYYLLVLIVCLEVTWAMIVAITSMVCKTRILKAANPRKDLFIFLNITIRVRLKVKKFYLFFLPLLVLLQTPVDWWSIQGKLNLYTSHFYCKFCFFRLQIQNGGFCKSSTYLPGYIYQLKRCCKVLLYLP